MNDGCSFKKNRYILNARTDKHKYLMLIRKNTKAFKAIKEVITACSERSDRRELVRLYITRAGNSIAERIPVANIQGEADLFYDMTYDTVRTNLESPDRQLYQSDEEAGIYFFQTSSNKGWDETPFEFDPAIKPLFASLPELPAVRKKEKGSKFVFPVAKKNPAAKTDKKEQLPVKKTKQVTKSPKQPDYHLKQHIHFTQPDQVVFKHPRVTKKEVLDYYDKMADTLLPYLKDRPLSVCMIANGRTTEYTNLDVMAEDVTLPDWIERANPASSKESGRMIRCQDKEQLLWLVENGCIEFRYGLSRTKSLTFPDYLVIEIHSSEKKRDALIDAAHTTHTILSGLLLPSLVQTDGKTRLYIAVPLDTKSNFKASKAAGEMICRLIQLKVPHLVAIEGVEGDSYGKVALNYLFNAQSEYVVAPYSLIAGEEVMVAAPLSWDEPGQGFDPDHSDFAGLYKMLLQQADSFALPSRKKVNADELLERMKVNYSFLL